MDPTPRKFKLYADTIFSILAVLAAILWMILIFLSGMTVPAYLAAAAFVVCAGASSLLHFHAVKDLPEAEKEPAQPISFLRRIDKADSYCTNCGGPLRQSDTFCPKCGTKKVD